MNNFIKPLSILKLSISLSFFQINFSNAQTICYDNFEGNKSISYSYKSGKLDSSCTNPFPDKVNNSSKCAKYARNNEFKFDVIKMKLNGKLLDVSPYTTHYGIPPKLKMKLFSNAPVGTLIEVLFGNSQKNNAYPGGTHSQFQAYTTKKGEWEELTFTFAQIPEGSETSSVEIDQITILFNPNSMSKDTFYFDEITGPLLLNDPKNIDGTK